MTNARYVVALIVAALCWGSSASITKVALAGFPPMTLLFVELFTACVLLWAILLRRGFRKPDQLWRYALLGFFEPALAYAGLNIGLTATSAANASLLESLEACLVVLLAVVFLSERLSRRAVLGVVIAIAGAVVLEGAHSLLSVDVGDLFVVGGALSAAVYVTLASKLASRVDPMALTTYQFTFGLVFVAPVVIFQWLFGREQFPVDVAPGYWVAAVVAGAVGFVASFLLYNHAIAVVPAGTAGMTLNLIPLFGVLTAVLALREQLTLGQVGGAVLIIGGLVLFSLDSRQRTERARPSEGEKNERVGSAQPPHH
jgi:drug/metabolite transporter (DMT)-like permease